MLKRNVDNTIVSKESSHSQRLLEIARAEGYPMDELLKYDVIRSTHLSCNNGVITQPKKSDPVPQILRELSVECSISPVDCAPNSRHSGRHGESAEAS